METFTYALKYAVVSMVMLLLVRSNPAAAKTVSTLAMTSPGVGRGEDARMKILAPSRDAVLRILEIIIALPNSVIPNNINNKMGRTKANSIMVCPFLSLRNNFLNSYFPFLSPWGGD